MGNTNRPLRRHLVASAVGAAIALTALAPAMAAQALPNLSVEGASSVTWADAGDGSQVLLVDGARANTVFATDTATGDRYWFEQGSPVREHAFFDAATNAWYWADADGTIAHGKDVFIPVDESDRSKGGKWVRIDDDYTMVKGDDVRVSPDDGQVHRWHFDPVTGEMSKNFTIVDNGNGPAWAYFDDITGWMLYGQQYKPNNSADFQAGVNFHWYYFDEETGELQYGWKDIPSQDKTVYYDDTMGWMVYGWQNVGGTVSYFNRTTGALEICVPIEWKPCEKYSRGREGRDWDTIVLHTTQIPTLEGVDEQFADVNGRDASAHFAVGGTEVHQYVALSDTAWAVGDWNANTRTVSIEHVGTSEEPPSYETLDTSAKLMAALAASKGWTSLELGRNVNVHSVYTDTPCPFGLDVDWLVARANSYLAQTLGA